MQCPECGSPNVSGWDFPGLYDGVLLWECDRCGKAWPRFPEGLRHEQAEAIIEGWRKP